MHKVFYWGRALGGYISSRSQPIEEKDMVHIYNFNSKLRKGVKLTG
jgi:hypothetical protein